MTPGDVARLLAACALYDFRTVDDEVAEAWYLIIGDLDYADAERAVLRHYAESTEMMKPAHVRAGVKAIRAQRRQLQPHPARALPSPFEKPDMGRKVRVARGMAGVHEVLDAVVGQLAIESAGPDGVSAVEQLRALTPGPGVVDGEPVPNWVDDADWERAAKPDPGVIEGEVAP